MLRIYTGPMFSGKTTHLLKALDACHLAMRSSGGKGFVQTVVAKWSDDIRSGSSSLVVTHDNRVWSTNVQSFSSLDELELTSNGRCLIAVDEAQFFGEDLIRLWERVAARSASKQENPATSDDHDAAHSDDVLLVAGLDLDFRNERFGHVLDLMERYGVQEFCKVKHLSAMCYVPGCTNPAHFSMRTVANDGTVLVGGASEYQPACAKHHHLPIPTRHNHYYMVTSTSSTDSNTTTEIMDEA